MNKENILGFDVCVTDIDRLVDDVFNDFDSKLSNFIVNINPEIAVDNYKNLKLKKEFNNQKYQIADGIGIVLASKIKGGNIKSRITGIDLMKAICSKSCSHSSKIFLYGAKSGVAIKAKEKLEKEYEGINIVGTCDGYVKEEKAALLIKESDANILFTGLGSPKQEEFILKNKEILDNLKIFLPVGGSFDVISGNIKRAPKWIIKLNLEWLYRLCLEPKRIFRQIKLIKFFWYICIYGRKNE